MTVTLISERTTRVVLEADRRAVIAAVGDAYRINARRSSDSSGAGRRADRAGAVLLLDDLTTGSLRTALSAAPISVHRTAASVALVAEQLAARRPVGSAVGLVGAGPVGAEILRYLALVLPLSNVVVADLDPARATLLAEQIDGTDGLPAASTGPVEQALAQPLVVVSAATAPTLRPDRVVLHICLRDLANTTGTAAHHVVDDPEHIARVAASFGLVRKQGDLPVTTVAQLLGGAAVPVDVPLVFSSFGMGCLDLATADLVARDVEHAEDGVLRIAPRVEQTSSERRPSAVDQGEDARYRLAPTVRHKARRLLGSCRSRWNRPMIESNDALADPRTRSA